MLALDVVTSFGTSHSSGPECSVRSLIDMHADARHEDTFLVCPDFGTEITFASLKEDAILITCFLQEQGLEKGDKVAFLLDNGIYTAELFLSIMYGGFVAVPLNVTSGGKALSQTLTHSDSKIVFVSPKYDLLINEALSLTTAAIQSVVYKETIRTELDRGHDSQLSDNVLPQDDALIAYTSGSTGLPKGALFSHANVIAGGYNTAVAHDLSPKDKSLCALPLYHMNAQVVTLLSTLISGGSVVVPQHFNPKRFWHQVAQYGCTWFALVPTIVTQLLQDDALDGAELDALRKHVRFARSSSAPLSPTAHRQFESRFNLPMIEAMGMTEAGGAIFSNPLPPCKRKIGSPGIPYGFDVRIVGPANEDLLHGEVGELFLRGPSVMRSYYKSPSTEENRIIDGWISTGDLGWQDEDGFIFISGRKTDIINKGGEKIAPREIEEFLLRQPCILEAAVLGVSDVLLGQDIAAFVVFKPGFDRNPTSLSQRCESELGTLKTPGRIFVLSELPKGTAHKINRSALAQLAQNPVSTDRFQSDMQAPIENESIEKQVLSVMAELLEQPQLAPKDNFFDFGGYSLRAMQLVQRLSRKFSLQIPVSALFQGPTAAQLATCIQTVLSGGTTTWPASYATPRSLVIIRESGQKQPLFFTPGGTGGDEEFIVYARLVRFMDNERPFYGFKSRASIDVATPHSSVEHMASDYIQEMRAIQARGPYFLAGECNGAVIAYEMARQLSTAGEEVGSLVLLDCQAPSPLNYLLHRLTWFRNRVMGIAGRSLPDTNTLDLRADPSLSQRERDRRWLNYKRPLLQYSPGAYSGSITLLLSEECLLMKFHDTWKKHCLPSVKTVVVPGSHYDYIRKNAQVTAKALDDILGCHTLLCASR